MDDGLNLVQDRKEKLREVLLKKPNERTPDDIDDILTIVEDNEFLKQFKNSKALRELCRYMKLQHFNARDTIFEQDDEGDCFYIIYSGRVAVYVHDKQVAELNKGKYFGELSLIFGDKRSATIMAVEPSDLIVLDKDMYDKVIKSLQMDQIANITEFFEFFPLFHDLDRKYLLKIATKVIYKTLPTNTIIIRQGDYSKSIYFIKTGKVKLLKKIDFKTEGLEDMEKCIQDPSEEDIEKEEVETKLLEIDELGIGDCFGDYSLIKKEPIQYSVVTYIPTEIFILDQHDFNDLDDRIKNEFIEFQKEYPNDVEIRRAYYEMKKWEKFKEDLIHGIVKSK
jgi:CRP-like cAMP-binding protein